ncbi:hypothetical protein BC629DRAFT_1557125 [Irpex lacteus]|nr:hypothetical protein BC629DRAFT_1557125 [Irpex lacteus]
MFSIGSVEGGSSGAKGSKQQFYDGVPRVHLYDDAEDVAGFIGALYNTATLPLTKNCRDTPLKVQGIMRLAVKYETDTIRSVILRHIESEWPQTLAQWERRQNERNKLVLLPDETPSYPDPALAVRFGMEFSCDEILPAAFYELAITQDISTGPKATIAWECLHASDLLTLVHGQKRLAEAWAEMVRKLEVDGREYCECGTFTSAFGGGYTTSACRTTVANCIVDAMLDEPVLTDPLSFLHRVHGALGKEFVHFTSGCNDIGGVIGEGLSENAQLLWDDLPLHFGLVKLWMKRRKGGA